MTEDFFGTLEDPAVYGRSGDAIGCICEEERGARRALDRASRGRLLHEPAARLRLAVKSGNPEVAEAMNTEVLDFGIRALQQEHPCASSGLPRCGAMGNVGESRRSSRQAHTHGWQRYDDRGSQPLSSLIVLARVFTEAIMTNSVSPDTPGHPRIPSRRPVR
jgi:hypothetical protein